MLIIRFLVIYLLFCIPFSSFARDEDPRPSSFDDTEIEETILENDRSSPQTSRDTPTSLPKEESAEASIPLDMPLYKPPMRGAPAGRIAGGTRGEPNELPRLYVLAPDHVGLTVQEQPCLYWFLSKPTSYPIELTVIEDQAITPLLKTMTSGDEESGIHSVRFANYDIHLKTGVRYKWFVSLINDPALNTRVLIAGGVIERIPLSKELRDNLDRAGSWRAPYVYAEEGIWYDSLTSISDIIMSVPDRSPFRMQRASLLEQAGLSEVAEYEKIHSVK